MQTWSEPGGDCKLAGTRVERASSRDSEAVQAYFAAGPCVPVIFTDALDDVRAFADWTLEGLARDHAADFGLVWLGFTQWNGGRATTLGDFIATLDRPASEIGGFGIGADYCPASVPPGATDALWSFMWDPLGKQPELRGRIGPCPAGAGNLVGSLDRALFDTIEKAGQNAFFSVYVSRTGTVTPWHADYHGRIGSVVQIDGSKRVILMPGYADDDASNAAFDPENPDFDRFPQLAGRPVFSDVLEGGELLIIPPDWWHHVRALSHSVTLSHNFFIHQNASRFLTSVLDAAGERIDAAGRVALQDLLMGGRIREKALQ